MLSGVPTATIGKRLPSSVVPSSYGLVATRGFPAVAATTAS
jgi:hypothetical protein